MIFGQLAMQNSHEMLELDPRKLGKTVARVFLNGIGHQLTVVPPLASPANALYCLPGTEFMVC